MANDEILRQQLLELAYGLFDGEEEAALRRRIESDPQMAAMYADAQRQAALFAEASRLAAPRIKLSPAAVVRKSEDGAASHAMPAAPRKPLGSRLSWNWLVSIAASLMLLVTAGGYFYQTGRVERASVANMRLVVSGPSRPAPNVDQFYNVHVARATGEPESVKLQLTVSDTAGETLVEHRGVTDFSGNLAVRLPAKSAQRAARLQVTSLSTKAPLPTATAKLQPESEPVHAHLGLDRYVYRPGDEVRYRAVGLGEQSLLPAEQLPLQVELRSQSANGAAIERQEHATVRGVVGGSFSLGEQTAPGDYAVTVESAAADAKSNRTMLRVEQQALGERRRAELPTQVGPLDVRFYPEGGELQAYLPQRVYFSVRDAQGKPQELRGEVQDAAGRVVAEAKTSYQGLGVFTLEAAPHERYALHAAPAKPMSGPAAPAVKVELPLAAQGWGSLDVPQSVVSAGEDLSLHVMTRESGRLLLAVVACRGAEVGQMPFLSAGEGQDVKIPLADGAAGVLRVTLFDYSESPARPLAERLVYRAPQHKLDVAILPPDDPTAGGTAQLTVAARDENNQPVAAVFGVSVADETLLDPAGKQASLTTDFYFAAHLARAPEIENADFLVSPDPAAHEALDLVLGTYGWRRFVSGTEQTLLAAADNPRGAAPAAGAFEFADDQAGAMAKSADFDESLAPATLDQVAVTAPTLFDNQAAALAGWEAARAQSLVQQSRWLRLGLALTLSVILLYGAVLLVARLRGASPQALWLVPALAAAAGVLMVSITWRAGDRQVAQFAAPAPAESDRHAVGPRPTAPVFAPENERADAPPAREAAERLALPMPTVVSPIPAPATTPTAPTAPTGGLPRFGNSDAPAAGLEARMEKSGAGPAAKESLKESRGATLDSAIAPANRPAPGSAGGGAGAPAANARGMMKSAPAAAAAPASPTPSVTLETGPAPAAPPLPAEQRRARSNVDEAVRQQQYGGQAQQPGQSAQQNLNRSLAGEGGAAANKPQADAAPRITDPASAPRAKSEANSGQDRAYSPAPKAAAAPGSAATATLTDSKQADIKPADKQAAERKLAESQTQAKRQDAKGDTTVLREFAHINSPRSESSARPVGTLYWNPLLFTDEQGRATIQFDLPPRAGRYRVQVDAHASDGRTGRIGSSSTTIVVPPPAP